MVVIFLWLAAFFGVLLVLWLLIKHMLEKYAQSKFVKNVHNGVMVLARRDDYLKAKREQKNSEFIMVPNTFAFSSLSTPDWIDKSLLLGDMKLYYDLIGNEMASLARDLFVPYVSSKEMSKEDQERFFYRYCDIEIAKEYLQANGNLSAFVIGWRRLTRWYHKKTEFNFYANSITSMLSVAIVILLLASLIAYEIKQDNERKWTFIGNTSVDNPVVITHTEAFPIPVTSDELDTTLSEDTLTSEPIYMGGNLISVQVESKKGYVTHGVRANANLNLKKGDTVTVRRGMIMNATGAYGFEAWVITPAEAKALVASGKFHYHQ